MLLVLGGVRAGGGRFSLQSGFSLSVPRYDSLVPRPLPPANAWEPEEETVATWMDKYKQRTLVSSYVRNRVYL